MRRLAASLLLLPLACAPQSSETKDPPPSKTDEKAEEKAEEKSDEKNEPADEKAPTNADGDGDCIKTGGLPPGSIPESVAKFADLDLAALEAALPKDPRDPDMANTETRPWKRGAAGHASPLVMRSIQPKDAGTTLVSITDLVHICHLKEGMGDRLREKWSADGYVTEEIEGRKTAVKEQENVTDLRIWIADRCELLIRSPTRKEAEDLFRATGWEALDKTCGERGEKAPG